MSVLEQLGISTKGLVETFKPFELWEGSRIKDWTFTLQLLSVGDLAEIAKWTSGSSIAEVEILKKIYLLAKALVDITGQPLVTDEDVASYNDIHNLNGVDKITLFRLKVIYLRQLNEVIVNKLVYTYDQLEEKYLVNHLGDALYKAVRTLSNVDILNSAAAANSERLPVESSPENANESAAPTTP